MFLKHTTTGKMVEVLSLRDLFNPMHGTIIGRYHYGEEAQDPESFDKSELAFCSDEPMPKCWTDVHYRDVEAMHHYKEAS
ncbi:MAG: acetyltransferase [Chromatiaceae bacterium]|jgi:hypothetical protein